MLALVGLEVKKDAPLAKACAKAGDVLDYDVAKRNLPGWVAERFSPARRRGRADACAALVQLVGEDLHALAAEIEKIATWAAGEPVGEREVEQLVAATADTPTFALTDAWARRDPAARSQRRRRSSSARAARGATPRRGSRLRSAAIWHGCGSLKRLAAEGVRPRDAPASWACIPSTPRRSTRQAEAFSEEELRDATVRLADLDLALKGDSRLAPDLELQRALIDLAASRAAASRAELTRATQPGPSARSEIVASLPAESLPARSVTPPQPRLRMLRAAAGAG